MLKAVVLISVLAAMLALVPLVSMGGSSAMGEGCQDDCNACHSLTKDEAAKLLKDSSVVPVDAGVANITIMKSVGLWKVTLDLPDEKPLYIDFGKKNVFVGEFFPLKQPIFEDSSKDLLNGE